MRAFNKFAGLTGLFLAFAAAIISPDFSLGQTISQPANPDTMFCATRGSVATRLATRWQCLTPGVNGQVLKSGGPGADVGWQTLSGTGTVTSVDMSVPASLLAISGNPITTAGTLAITLPTQTTNLVFASPNGSTGAPTFRALAGADIPAINLAGTGNGGITGTLPLTNIPTVTVAKGGTNATSASGTALDNITGFAGTGILRRTGAGTYTQGTTVSVAEGGTNATSASGTALDNITGFSGTGVIQRTGAGTYTFNTIPAILGSQTANFIYAAPSGSSGTPVFRAMTSADIPANAALAGSPTTTTQVNTDNTTNIATTAFVQSVVNTLPGGPTNVYKSSDQTVSASTTLVADNSLAFTMSASTRYSILVNYNANPSTTGGVKIGYSLPATVTASSGSCAYNGNGAAVANASGSGTSGTVTIFSSASGTGGIGGAVNCVIVVDVAGTGGTFTMQVAQSVGTGTVIYYRGSVLSYKAF